MTYYGDNRADTMLCLNCGEFVVKGTEHMLKCYGKGEIKY